MPKLSMYHRSFQSVFAISGIFLAALAGAHLNNPELLISDSFARAFISGTESRANSDGRSTIMAGFQTSWAQSGSQQYSWQIEPVALRSPSTINAPMQTAPGEQAADIKAGIATLLNVGNRIVVAPTSRTQRTTPIILEITDARLLMDGVTRLDTSLSPEQWVLINARLMDGDDSQLVQFVVELPAQTEPIDQPETEALLQQNPAQML